MTVMKNSTYSVPETEVIIVNGGYLMAVATSDSGAEPHTPAPMRNPLVD